MELLGTTEKGKPLEKAGRKASGLLHDNCNDGWAAWNTKSYFRGEKVLVKERGFEGLDQEWIALIMEAKEIGLESDLVRDFLSRSEKAALK